MKVSAGELGDLLGTTFDWQYVSSLAFVSATTAGSLEARDESVTTLDATSIKDAWPPPAAGETASFQVAAANDAANTILLNYYVSGTLISSKTEYVIGYNAQSILISPRNSATIATLIAGNVNPSVVLEALSSVNLGANPGTPESYSAAGTYTGYVPGSGSSTTGGQGTTGIEIRGSTTSGSGSGSGSTSPSESGGSFTQVSGGSVVIPLLKRQAVIDVTNGTGTVSGPGVADALTSVTQIRFIDGTLAYGAGTPEAAVDRLYQAAFGRAPDASGLAYWAASLQSGTSLADIAAGFMASQESQARFGSTPDNASFVNELYQNVLGRAGDASGAAFWIGALDSGSASQAQVLADFSASAEATSDTASQMANGLWAPDPDAASVARLYYTALDRAPDASGLDYWTSQIENNGATLMQEATSFVNSAEFTADYGSLDNGAFVSLLYQNTLGRDADPTGLAAWTNQLAQGGSRAGVVLAFSESAEQKARLAPFIEQNGIVAT